MINFPETNEENGFLLRYTRELEEFRLQFADPSSGELIPRQKKLYEQTVKVHTDLIIKCLEDKIEKRYNHELIRSVRNYLLPNEMDSFKQELLLKELSKLDYVFEDKPTTERIILTLPIQKSPLDYDIQLYPTENHEETEIKEAEILALRDFYKRYCNKQLLIDYRQVPVFKLRFPFINAQYRKWVFAGAVVQYYLWIIKQCKLLKPKKHIPTTILDIWKPDNTGSKKEYDRILEKLKIENPKIGCAFITEDAGQLYWNRNIHGSIQYLAAWLYVCIKQNWIDNTLTAPQYMRILNHTFNAHIGSSTPFKSINVTPPNDKHYAFFKNIPKNLP